MIEKSKLYFYSFCTIFWILAIKGFIFQDVLPALSVIESPLRLIIDMAVIILGSMTLSKRRDILVVVSFLLLSFFSTVFLNKESILTYINGVREFVGLLFIVPLVRRLMTDYRRDVFISSFDRQLLVFLALQLVAIPYQTAVYGAGDNCGGTLGNGMSGAISTIIYIGTFYIVSRRWNSDSYLQSLNRNWMYFLLLLPSFLNETKVSFIYFILFFLLLLGLKAKAVFNLLLSLPVVIVILAIAGNTYLHITQMQADTFVDPEFYDEYLLGADTDHLLEVGENYHDGDYYELEDQWAIDLPRFFKILQGPSLVKETKGGLMFGAGLGQFKGGTNMNKTAFAQKYDYMLRGTVPMLYDLTIQLGLVGIVWFFWNIFTVINFRNRRVSMSLNVKVQLTLIILIQMCYGVMLTYIIMDMILFYVAFRTCNMLPEEDKADAGN